MTLARWFSVLALLLTTTACLDSDKSSANAITGGVVSLDYCADQYVLQFVPREEIRALSADAGKYFSYLRDQASGIATVRASAEDVISLQPDLVVRSYGGGPNALRLMETAGIKTLQLGFPQSISDVREHLLGVSKELGAERSGVQLLQEFDRKIENAKFDRSTAPTILYTTPGGVTTGPGSLIHELLESTGYSNFEQRPGWHSLPLERLVQDRPQYIAAASFGNPDTHVDPWTLARHPVLKSLLSDLPATEIQGAWTSCGGWFIADAVVALGELRTNHDRGRKE